MIPVRENSEVFIIYPDNITKICHRISMIIIMIIIHDQRSIIGLSSDTMSSDGTTTDRCVSLDQNDQALEMERFRS